MPVNPILLGQADLNWPVEVMRFTLTYSGPLHAASDGDKRTQDKHRLREEFQPQLRDVWSTTAELGAKTFNAQRLSRTNPENPPDEAALDLPFKQIGAFRFVPLVSRILFMVCDLDILFLRREPRGFIVNFGGDIDNRLKVLFDALRNAEGCERTPLG